MEYNQSDPVGSNLGYVIRINRELGNTKTAKGEYCNVVPDCIVQYFKGITLINKIFSVSTKSTYEEQLKHKQN